MREQLFLRKSASEIVKGYSDFRNKFDSAGPLKRTWLKLRHPIFYHYHREGLDIRTSTEKLTGEHDLRMAKSLAGEYKRIMEQGYLKARELEDKIAELEGKLAQEAELSEKIISSKNRSLANLQAQLEDLRRQLEKGGKKRAGELP